ncbi:MAG: hypothetical protein GY847_08135 [Proteobacteria bacterium]|nr:hypothetical protein [Pseudomonadota bacterium]
MIEISTFILYHDLVIVPCRHWDSDNEVKNPSVYAYKAWKEMIKLTELFCDIHCNFGYLKEKDKFEKLLPDIEGTDYQTRDVIALMELLDANDADIQRRLTKPSDPHPEWIKTQKTLHKALSHLPPIDKIDCPACAFTRIIPYLPKLSMDWDPILKGNTWEPVGYPSKIEKEYSSYDEVLKDCAEGGDKYAKDSKLLCRYTYNNETWYCDIKDALREFLEYKGDFCSVNLEPTDPPELKDIILEILRDGHAVVDFVCMLCDPAFSTFSSKQERTATLETSNSNGVTDRPDVQPETSSKSDYLFKCEGKTWRVIYDGFSATVLDRKGMKQIAYLLAHPDVSTSTYDLRRLVNPPANDSARPPTGNVKADSDLEIVDYKIASRSIDNGHDLEMKKRGRLELKELDEEIDEAERNNDQSRIGELKETRRIVLKEYGHIASKEDKKANDSVMSNLKNAYKALKDVEHNALYEHLTSSINKNGTEITYRPQRDHQPWDVID